MLEKTIQSNIIEYLQSLTCCDAENVLGTINSKGRPDINACFRGRLIRIEVKTPDHGNKPSDIQIANLKRWAKAGAVCFVAYSLEEVKAVVTQQALRCDTLACLSCPIRREYCYTNNGVRGTIEPC